MYQSLTKWVFSEDLFVALFQGTVTPTHYVVIHDTANMKTDHVQQLALSPIQLAWHYQSSLPLAT
jgi:hypothetical protein